jgi:Pentapeptide repeats (8 copies)
LTKNEEYRKLAKAKIQDQQKMLLAYETRNKQNAKRAANLAGANMAYTDNTNANMQDVNLAETLFDFSNLKNTQLEGSNVFQTYFRKAKNLNPFALLKTKNAESLVVDANALAKTTNRLIQQNRQQMTLQEEQEAFPQTYLSPKHYNMLFPLISTKVLAQKKLMETAPNAWWKTLPTYLKKPVPQPKKSLDKKGES